MDKGSIKHFINGVKKGTTKHAPDILTGIGVATMFGTVVLAVKATPAALELIEEAKQEKKVDKLTPVETVQATWKCYIPAAISGAVSVGCIIGANSVNARRSAALATAYTLSETAFNEYRDKVKETIGEKKETEVRKSVARDKVKQAPVNEGAIIYTNRGNTLCYDALSGRHFYSDREVLKKGANEINRRMRTELFISLNEFYQEIGLPPIDLGDDIGWHIDRGYIDPVFDAEVAPNGQPCLVMDFCVKPRPDTY